MWAINYYICGMRQVDASLIVISMLVIHIFMNGDWEVGVLYREKRGLVDAGGIYGGRGVIICWLEVVVLENRRGRGLISIGLFIHILSLTQLVHFFHFSLFPQ